MSLRKVTVSILVALLAAGVTAGAYRHSRQKKAGEAAYLRYKNSQLRLQAYLNQQQQPTRSLSAAPRPAGAPSAAHTLTEGITPVAPESYCNQGYATPTAALQTLAWACDRSDAKNVAQMLQFEPVARAKAEACFNKLPEPERVKCQSLENLAATQLTLLIMARPFPTADILDLAKFETPSEDRAIFHGLYNDRTMFRKSGDTWKVVITEELFDRLQNFSAEIQAANVAKP